MKDLIESAMMKAAEMENSESVSDDICRRLDAALAGSVSGCVGKRLFS